MGNYKKVEQLNRQELLERIEYYMGRARYCQWLLSEMDSVSKES